MTQSSSAEAIVGMPKYCLSLMACSAGSLGLNLLKHDSCISMLIFGLFQSNRVLTRCNNSVQ